VVAQPKVYVCGRLVAGVMVFESRRGHGCLFCVLCAVRNSCNRLIHLPENFYLMYVYECVSVCVSVSACV
jgi:hypothetical protein